MFTMKFFSDKQTAISYFSCDTVKYCWTSFMHIEKNNSYTGFMLTVFNEKWDKAEFDHPFWCPIFCL